MKNKKPAENLPKVLFMGPLTPPVNGQAVAFTDVYEHYIGRKTVINSRTKGGALAKVIYYLTGLLLTLTKSIFNTYDCAYFTCSRTYKGSLRDIMFVLIARAKGARVINHLHGADLNSFYQSAFPLYQRLISNTYAKIDTTVILLDGMIKEFRHLAPSMQCVTISNSYGDGFNNLEFAETVGDGAIRLIYFSNLMYSKGSTYLLEAFEVLQQRYPRLRLDVIGKILGDDHLSEQEMCKVLKTYGRLKGVRFHDGLYGADKIDYLSQADVFVLPTFYKSEALPISMLEAMRAGAAIVVTNHNYLPSFFKPDMGAIVDPQDAGALVIAIGELIRDQARLAGAKRYNYDFAKLNCGKKNYTERVYAVIESISKSIR